MGVSVSRLISLVGPCRGTKSYLIFWLAFNYPGSALCEYRQIAPCCLNVATSEKHSLARKTSSWRGVGIGGFSHRLNVLGCACVRAYLNWARRAKPEASTNHIHIINCLCSLDACMLAYMRRHSERERERQRWEARESVIETCIKDIYICTPIQYIHTHLYYRLFTSTVTVPVTERVIERERGRERERARQRERQRWKETVYIYIYAHIYIYVFLERHIETERQILKPQVCCCWGPHSVVRRPRTLTTMSLRDAPTQPPWQRLGLGRGVAAVP